LLPSHGLRREHRLRTCSVEMDQPLQPGSHMSWRNDSYRSLLRLFEGLWILADRTHCTTISLCGSDLPQLNPLEVPKVPLGSRLHQTHPLLDPSTLNTPVQAILQPQLAIHPIAINLTNHPLDHLNLPSLLDLPNRTRLPQARHSAHHQAGTTRPAHSGPTPMRGGHRRLLRPQRHLHRTVDRHQALRASGRVSGLARREVGILVPRCAARQACLGSRGSVVELGQVHVSGIGVSHACHYCGKSASQVVTVRY